MKKKILTLVAMATLVTMMTACGTSETKDTSTTPSTTPVVTTEPTEIPEVTVEPTEVPEAPEVTIEPTEAPTQVPEVTPTETPVEPTEAPEVTVEPTEAPEVTVESTEVPTETPEEPAGNPSDVAEDPNFAVIKEMTENHVKDYETDSYSELEALIETLDKSRYEVTAVDKLDLIVPEDTAEADVRRYEEELFTDNGIFDLVEITTEDGDTDYIDVVPTGEFYVMTLTDNITGETIVWGLRVHAENIDNPDEYYVLTYSNGKFDDISYCISVRDCYTN